MQKHRLVAKASIVVLMGLFVLLVEYRYQIVSYAPNIYSRFLYRYGNMKYLRDEPAFRKLQSENRRVESLNSGMHTHSLHFNHSEDHRSAWMHLEEVDGLKNTDVVMVVTSTSIKDGYLLRERYAAVNLAFLPCREL